MPAAPSLIRLFAALALALVLLTTGAVLGQPAIAICGAGIFAASILTSALSVGRTASIGEAARHHTLLAALSYAWAACAFAAAYSLSDLVWFHAHQYGIGAALGACGLFALHRRLTVLKNVEPPSVALTAFHAAAAAAGLTYLVSTGKLLGLRSDWPGNVIFAAGGITIIGLCAIAIRKQLETRQTGN